MGIPRRGTGAVGYGPEYARGAGFEDKIGGLSEELRGKVMRKPELVEHGRERRTGELKRKEKAQADAVDPPNDEDQKLDQDEVKPAQSQSAEPELRRDESARAATTAPAGTQKDERQVREGNSDTARIVDDQ
ncbi:hypothetical protein EWM64_g7004 [Hericium alpestre]|uniref:Uncharacterized protein n=1 Tax=Hericium alpestre TaxID=135208 RepID=A0A4Y9ZU22_9AGAM|nr:hypothetical protein EWM64_g7004 [Hericium alpestre]